jgi:hypothetical protein
VGLVRYRVLAHVVATALVVITHADVVQLHLGSQTEMLREEVLGSYSRSDIEVGLGSAVRLGSKVGTANVMGDSEPETELESQAVHQPYVEQSGAKTVVAGRHAGITSTASRSCVSKLGFDLEFILEDQRQVEVRETDRQGH